jgi:Glycosyl transferase family 8
MRWFLGLNHDAPHYVAYADMVRAAVLSAGADSGLQPHLLFDGPECDLTRWFRAHDGRVIFRESFLKPRLLAAAADPETRHAAAHGNGVFLRAEIPDVLREHGWDDERVLYTDNDVLLTPRFRAADLPAATHAIAVGSEIDRDDHVNFNSGVMLFHLPRWWPLHERFKAFLAADLPHSLRADWDQHSFRKFFRGDVQPLDAVWNWKPYWGENPDARLVHFHGPKPFLRDAIRQGTAHPVQIQLASDYFWQMCERYDRLLAVASP